MPAVRMAAESRTKPDSAHTTGMSIVNVTVASNVAQAGTAAGGTSGTAYGGGIDNDDKLDFQGTSSPPTPPWW